MRPLTGGRSTGLFSGNRSGFGGAPLRPGPGAVPSVYSSAELPVNPDLEVGAVHLELQLVRRRDPA